MNLEDPVPALDELRGDAELLFDLVRQTGGSWFVVSNDAVLNRHLVRHGLPPIRQYSRGAAITSGMLARS